MPKMFVDATGKLVCPSNSALITYNVPWPTHNGTQGRFVEPAQGMVLHTEVGYEHSVEQEFNTPSAQASSFVSVGMDGHIHQYGPIGHGWAAWTQAAGNAKWRGIENEDHGNPSIPLTPAQIESNASILEALSAHDGFPLQVTDDPNHGAGLIIHQDGGAAWGGHSCPGNVRAGQRPAIVNRAKAIRGGTPPPKPSPTPAPSSLVEHLQQAVHAHVDGFWGSDTDARLQSVRNHTHDREEQRAVGTAVDGVWGPASASAENITIHRIQAALGVAQDGVWGYNTEKAYVAARTKYHH